VTEGNLFFTGRRSPIGAALPNPGCKPWDNGGQYIHNTHNVHDAHNIHDARNVRNSHDTHDDAHNGTAKYDETDNHNESNTHNQPQNLVLGPVVANAVDLLGQVRLINTWQEGSNYYLIDGSRGDMFDGSASDFPNEPVGVIWTIDAFNNAYDGNNFQYGQVVSPNNNWNDASSVSAHYNGGEAYEYFLNTFDRISINGDGGNIISLVNVAETSGPMDNAFWNGAAMFYGNGGSAFKPLARGLDVAGHEMSHGVIQATANLEYYAESGAMNESFADIFGAMIDRNDWKIGEDVVELSAFPSGALRDMANPNQGGSGLGSPGWQPDHMDDKYTGTQDNAGVHINSGIPNKAYYLFAEAIGKDDAEQIFYDALDLHLVKSSQFIDLRLAVIEATMDAFGDNAPQVSAAEDAFAAVGIGPGSGTDYQDDLNSNPGEDFIIATDDFELELYLYTGDGTLLTDQLATVSPISRPSLTDDGYAAVYVGTDGTIRAIFFDWVNETFTTDIISPDNFWRNVAVARDGSRIAALTNDFDNRIWIYDYSQGFWETFDLFNPTFTEGIETGDVQYADILEFDFSGEFVMYDALSTIESTFGTGIDYWDIGFVNVWNNNSGNWGDNFIIKLFTGLEEGVSVGNPTFSKNSDYIIAFDLINDFTGVVTVEAANVETGDVGLIWDQDVLAFPNYSIEDDQLIFNAKDLSGNNVLGIVDLNPDKITPAGQPVVFLEDRSKGVWFANGFRPLATEEVRDMNAPIQAFPNPVEDVINLHWEGQQQEQLTLEVFDGVGRSVMRTEINSVEGANTYALNVEELPTGAYVVRIGGVSVKVLKK
jgi:bacillolysin